MKPLRRSLGRNLRSRFLLINGVILVGSTLALTTAFFLQARSSLVHGFEKRGESLAAILAMEAWQGLSDARDGDGPHGLERRLRVFCQDGDVRYALVVNHTGATVSHAVGAGFRVADIPHSPGLEAHTRRADGGLVQYRVPLCEQHDPELDNRHGPADHAGCSPFGAVVLGVSNARITGAVEHAFWMSLLLGLGMTGAGLLGVWFMTRWAVRPLERIAEAARAVASGDLTVRADVDDDGEVGELARAFNEMTWSLADSQEEVGRRTEELQLVATEKERLYQNARGRATRLEVMNELAKAISSSLEPEVVFENVHQQLARIMQFEYFTVQRYMDETHSFRRDYVWLDEPVESVRVGQELRADETPIRRVQRTKMPLSIPDFDKDEALSSGWLYDAGFRSGFIVPIVAQDQFLGSLGLACRRKNAFARMEVATVFAVADTLAVVLRNVDLYSRLQESFTELRETQERLAKSEHVRRAEKLRSVGQMTSGIAHNFNNVMSAIIGRVQLLQLKSDRGALTDEELRRSLSVVERASLDGAETVRRLQEFSRGNKSDAAERADLGDLVRSVVEITRPRWKDQVEQTGVHIDVETDLGTVPAVRCVPGEIREILTNLVFNAVDAMPRGGTLTIATECVNDTAVIRVRDTGVGMDPDVRDRVFDPFFTTKGVKGSGLGLSTVYGIVERHGGGIEVESEEGEGTTFLIRLPLAKRDAPQPHREQLETTRPWRILVGDDEENVREALADLLRMLGHEVILAHDGRSTVEAFAAGRFDVVFTDLGMPDMSGWDVTQEVRKLDAHVPVILATGWGAQIDPDEAEARGVTRVLGKPFTVQKISSLVAELQGLDRAA